MILSEIKISMYMKKINVYFLLTILYPICSAQNYVVTGSVKNEKSIPVRYAFVQDKKVKSATYTDSLGSFSLRVDPNSTLIISSKGYKDALVKIDNKTNLQVLLRKGDAGRNNDDSQTGNSSFNVTANDAFTGHTNMNSAYNLSLIHISEPTRR